MQWWVWVVGVALGGVATMAGATPVRLSGFDSPDSGTTTAVDSWEFTETLANGAVDADARLVKQTTTPEHTHNDYNGGDPGTTLAADGNTASKWAFMSDVTSTEAAYYTLKADLTGLSQVTVGVNVHADSAPSAVRTILAVVESGGGIGCFVRENTDKTFAVYYRTTANAMGAASGRKLEAKHCTDNSGTTADERLLPCTADADCPSPSTCSASCTTSTGAGCAWIALELTQTNTNPTVQCDLRINGRLDVDGAPGLPLSPALVTNLRLGVSDTVPGESGSLTIWYDDLVVDDSDRAGMGYVTRKVPTKATGANTWNSGNGCSPEPPPLSNTNAYDCVDDYGIGSFTWDPASDDNIRTTSRNKVWYATTMGPAVVIPVDSSKITAVEQVLIGNASGTGTSRELQQAIMTCIQFGGCNPASGCYTPANCPEVPGPIFDPGDGTTPARDLGRLLVTRTPLAADPSWTATNIGYLAGRVSSTQNNTDRTDIGAWLQYIRVRRPDVALPITLKDHQKGTDDATRSVFSVGDSTDGGTLSVVCQGGTSAGTTCTYDSYCSWESVNKDKPTGGCGGTDALCQTCQLRRQEFNAGAGYPCGDNNGNATCNLGTCSGGLCGSTNVSCSVTADCDLGTCDTCGNADCSGAPTPASTCVTSCPGGTCPNNRTAWGDVLAETIGADVIVVCAQGLEGTATLAGTRLASLLDGAHASCKLVKGSPGSCTCADNDQCGGGTCTGGVCVSGSGFQNCRSDDECRYCVDNGDCSSGTCLGGLCALQASNSTCKFPSPDYLAIIEGYNDVGMTTSAPSCTGIYATETNSIASYPCDDPAGVTHCIRDSACDSHYTGTTDSQCLGTYTSDSILATGPETLCAGFGAGGCTMANRPCRVTADCTAYHAGLTCVGGSSADRIPQGFCACDTDDDCPTGYLCHGESSCATPGNCVCRLDCTAGGDATCHPTVTGLCTTGSGGATNGSTAPNDGKVCAGGCTYPSDARTCSTDANCAASATWYPAGVTYTWNGVCSAGRCTCTGPQTCRLDSTCATTFAQIEPQLQHLHTLTNFRTMEAAVAALSEGDGRPMLVFSTLPDLAVEECVHEAATSTRERGYYLPKVSQHLLTDFAHVANVRPAWLSYRRGALHSDDVHYNSLGAVIAGRAVGDYLNTLNACAQGQCLLGGETTGALCGATGDCTKRCSLTHATPCTVDGNCPGGETCQQPTCTFGPFARAQQYCRKPSNAYETTPSNGSCTKDADCPANDVCVPKPCTSGSDCPATTDVCNPE